MTWTLETAVALCARIERIAPLASCHVALTGGTLYKKGERKDIDIVFYRIRQASAIEADELIRLLQEECGFMNIRRCSPWCWKATHDFGPIDFFFPEEERVDYMGTEWDTDEYAGGGEEIEIPI